MTDTTTPTTRFDTYEEFAADVAATDRWDVDNMLKSLADDVVAGLRTALVHLDPKRVDDKEIEGLKALGDALETVEILREQLAKGLIRPQQRDDDQLQRMWDLEQRATSA